MIQTKTKSCGSKDGSVSRQEAESRMRYIIRRTGSFPPAYRVYKCKHCSLYHFGHKPRRKR